MKLVRLTLWNGDPVYINPEKVHGVTMDHEGDTLIVDTDSGKPEDAWCVREIISDVVNLMIREA